MDIDDDDRDDDDEYDMIIMMTMMIMMVRYFDGGDEVIRRTARCRDERYYRCTCCFCVCDSLYATTVKIELLDGLID